MRAWSVTRGHSSDEGADVGIDDLGFCGETTSPCDVARGRWIQWIGSFGLQLMEKEAGNFELPAFPGLIVKESYWRWPERDLAGNAIDFFVQILKMNFHDAMRQIIGS